MVMLLGLLLVAAIILAPGVTDAWWLELLRYLPYPGWLAAGLLAAVLTLRLGWAWRAAAAGGLLLVIWPIMGLQLQGGDAGGGRLRVMTYNVKSYHATDDGDYARIAWEVVQHDPDILVMQDAGMINQNKRSTNDSVRSMLRDRQIYHFGQYIVASRLPLRGCTPGDISYRGKAHTYVRCTVQVRGREVDLITAHLLSPREGLNATRHDKLEGLDDWRQNFGDRLSQARKLVQDILTTPAAAATAATKADAAPTKPRPLILAGDLNAPESSPVIQTLLDAGLRDAHSAAGKGFGYTHGHSLRLGFSFLRIDHILVSNDLGVADCFVGGKEGSEHRPVIADLWLDRH
ncbi:MAG: endonuclease/exonuclease/phosphatase family protein [Burkholderiales bacterium]|nr:endonuclease/exonuclease/phosphatase family protein [Burkholderiales bacterium]